MIQILSFVRNTVLPLVLIFCVKLSDVILSDLRMTFLLKGKKKLVFLFSFCEVLVYIYSLSFVLSNIKDPARLITYAVSYALGSVLSISIESKMSVGILTFLVVPSVDDNTGMIDVLKANGFGLTVLSAKSGASDDARDVLMVTTQRKNGVALREVIEETAPGSFMTIIDTKKVVNGRKSSAKKNKHR